MTTTSAFGIEHVSKKTIPRTLVPVRSAKASLPAQRAGKFTARPTGRIKARAYNVASKVVARSDGGLPMRAGITAARGLRLVA